MFEILFQYGSVSIRTFNILLAFGFLFSGIFIIRYINRRKLNISFFARYVIHILIAIIIGGRLFFVLENLYLFTSNPIYAFYVWDLNFSFFGGLYGFILALYLLAKRNKEDFWLWFDAGIITLMLVMVFVHTGHFFNGSQYGMPTELPWGIALSQDIDIPYTSPLHPTQLYSALLSAGIFLFSTKKIKRTHLSGIVGTMALMVYSIGIFGIDFFHGEPSLYVKISFGIIAALSFIFLVLSSHKKLNLHNS